jgi:hypothetical protein
VDEAATSTSVDFAARHLRSRVNADALMEPSQWLSPANAARKGRRRRRRLRGMRHPRDNSPPDPLSSINFPVRFGEGCVLDTNFSERTRSIRLTS